MPLLISQLTAPVATRWATLDQVKARLLATEITAGGAGLDALLSDLLDEASGAAVRILQRPAARAQYRQAIAGQGTSWLKLARGPLEAAGLTLTLRGADVDPQFYTIDSRHALIVRNDSSLWELTARYVGRAPGEAMPMGSDLVYDYSSDYWAGYRMPEQPNTDLGEPLPVELRGVVIRMVAAAYRMVKFPPPANAKSMKKADREIQWGNGYVIPAADIQILDDERYLVGPSA